MNACNDQYNARNRPTRMTREKVYCSTIDVARTQQSSHTHQHFIYSPDTNNPRSCNCILHRSDIPNNQWDNNCKAWQQGGWICPGFK